MAGLFPGLSGVIQPEDWNVYEYGDPKGERDLLWKMQHAEFYGMMQKTLRKVDLASMENSLEVRVPFLQKSFIEASLRVDPYLSYGEGKKKQLLKDLLTTKFDWYKDDGVKKGFNVPLGKWIREDLEPVFKERILEGQLSNLGMDKKEAERMFEEHIGQGTDRKWPLFTLYALDRFMNKEV